MSWSRILESNLPFLEYCENCQNVETLMINLPLVEGQKALELAAGIVDLSYEYESLQPQSIHDGDFFLDNSNTDQCSCTNANDQSLINMGSILKNMF